MSEITSVSLFDKLRFYIADQKGQSRSSVWFVEQRGSGIYLSATQAGGRLKLSFHPAGAAEDGCDSQFGMTRKYAEIEDDLGFNILRPIRWRRQQTPGTGGVQVASVVFPTEYLRINALSPRSGKPAIALNIAPTGHAVEVGVFYCRPNPTGFLNEYLNAGVLPLGMFTLPGDEFVLITARTIPFDVPLQWPSAMNPLSGAPVIGGTIKGAAILVRERPADGGSIMLVEANGLLIERNQRSDVP